jgi:hypothetical protein
MGIFYNPPPPPTANNAGTPPEPHVPIGTQGAQPPRYRVTMMMVAVLASWPQDLEPRLTKPNDQQTKIAPLTLAYGQQPPRFSIATRMEVIGNAWPLDLEPRLGRPNEQQQKIAPLTLTYGQQPQRQPALDFGPLLTIVGSWPLDYPSIQRPKISAPLLPPPPVVSVPYVRLPSYLYEQRDDSGDFELVSSVVQVPDSGDQPPRYSVAARMPALVAAWTDIWSAQTAPETAAWNVAPILTVLPYVPLPDHIWTAWQPPWYPPPEPVSIAPLLLTYGQQPIPQPPLSVLELNAIVATWVQTWDAQSAPKNAAWNVPPILSAVAYAPLPKLIWTAWEPPFVAPPRPVTIVTLTLPTGQQPPLTAAALARQFAAAVAAWTPEAPPPPPLLRSIAWNVIPAQVPSTELPALIWRAWEEPFIRPPGRVSIAPLTLVYGAQPRPQSPLALQKLVSAVAAWIQDWGPQKGPYNAAWVNFIPTTSGLKLIVFSGEQLREAQATDETLIVEVVFTDEGLVE